MRTARTSKTATHYWQGQGRKLIVIPREVLRSRVLNNVLLNQLYITDLGFYPAAATHYTFRKHGCPEMLIIICLNGKGKYEAKAGSFNVLPGQFFILPPNQQHKYEADSNDPWSIYWLRVSGVNIARFCMEESAKRCYKPVYSKNMPEVSSLFDDIYTTLENGYSLQHLTYSNMALQHVLALLLYRQQENKKKAISMTNKAIHFMRTHIGDHYSLKELATTFNYSPSQFSNIFKKETGYSPIDYFIHLKLQYGCRLLDLTDKKIYEVATEVGYDDPYHFSKLFKKIMHVSPQQYRSVKKG